MSSAVPEPQLWLLLFVKDGAEEEGRGKVKGWRSSFP
jgi:hypothetical protein